MSEVIITAGAVVGRKMEGIILEPIKSEMVLEETSAFCPV